MSRGSRFDSARLPELALPGLPHRVQFSTNLASLAALPYQSILQNFALPALCEQTPPVPCVLAAMATPPPARPPPAPSLSPAASRRAAQTPRFSVSLVRESSQEAPALYSPRKQNQTSVPIPLAAETNPPLGIALCSSEIACALSEWPSPKCQKPSFQIPMPPIVPRHRPARIRQP